VISDFQLPALCLYMVGKILWKTRVPHYSKQKQCAACWVGQWNNVFISFYSYLFLYIQG